MAPPQQTTAQAHGVARSKKSAAKIRDAQSASRKHVSTDVEDVVADRVTQHHDLGPWQETPNSSRVSRLRYDYLNRAIQVQWRNNKNHGYIYEDVPYEGFRGFARVVSKGRYINSTLNGYSYRPMTVDEVDAPSNDRRGLVSRARP